MEVIILDIKIIYKSIDDLVPYENNPRINDNAVEFVASSIKEFGFKNPIIIDGENVIVAGHTRLKAAQKLKIQNVPCVVVDDLTQEQVNAFRLADNKTAELAEWDLELLNSELELIDGIDMAEFGFEDELQNSINDTNEDNTYTQKITTPVYEPTGEDVSIDDLVDTSVRDNLVRRIQMSDIPDDVSEFLIMAAQRHLKFNYHNIAEYYANAPSEIQELFEDSALVIIDYDKAIELGYVKLSDSIQEMIAESEGMYE